MISLPTFRGVLSSFSPLSLAPALWVTDTGSDPSVWTDMSGNGRHAVQATGANQPSIVTNVINGRQVRRFDGTNDRFIPPDFSLDEHTIFSVVVPNIATSSVNTIFSIGSIVNNSRDTMVFFDQSLGNQFNIQRSNGSLFPTAQAAATNLTAQITTAKFTGTQLIAYINNGTRGIVSTSITGTSSNKPVIGAVFEPALSYFFKGDIAEIIVYPSSLSDSNCLRVERYLSKKYNITIA